MIEKGTVFQHWEYICNGDRSGYVRCKCIECGYERDISKYHLVRGNGPKCECMKVPWVGRKYGYWEVIGECSDSSKVLCKCHKCGKTVREVRKTGLTSGRSRSCGCDLSDRVARKVNLKHNLFGMTFGEWEVKDYLGNGYWECKCSCGTVRRVSGYDLTNGKTTSCGCMKGYKAANTMLERYGAANISQIGCSINAEQRAILSDPDNLLRFIQTVERPRTIEKISNRMGVRNGSVRQFVDKFNLWEHVDVCKAASQYEDEIALYVESLGVKCERNNRSALKGFEIDIYIPSKKLGIEFNGSYWHSEVHKLPDYHKKKNDKAYSNGIRLIQVFEHEWKDDKDKIKDLIHRAVASDSLEHIPADSCVLVEICECVGKDFEDRYSLEKSSDIHIGLYYTGHLIGCMSFTDLGESKYRLDSITYKHGTTVDGGVLKMFKEFTSKYKPSTVEYNLKPDKYDSDAVTSCGFIFDSYTEPECVWYDDSEKKVVDSTGGEESLRKMGYVRIYDSGRYKFIWRA